MKSFELRIYIQNDIEILHITICKNGLKNSDVEFFAINKTLKQLLSGTNYLCNRCNVFSTINLKCTRKTLEIKIERNYKQA